MQPYERPQEGQLVRPLGKQTVVSPATPHLGVHAVETVHGNQDARGKYPPGEMSWQLVYLDQVGTIPYKRVTCLA